MRDQGCNVYIYLQYWHFNRHFSRGKVGHSLFGLSCDKLDGNCPGSDDDVKLYYSVSPCCEL